MSKRYTPKIIVLFLNLIIFFVVFSCTGEKKEIPRDNELIFNIDSSLISATISDSALLVKFNPPKLWLSVNSEKFNFDPLDIPAINLNPLFSFANLGDSSSLRISKIISKDSPSSDTRLFSVYDSLLKSACGKNLIKSGSFKKDGFTIHQYLIRKSGFIKFLLLFFNAKGDILVFNYSAKNGNYLNVLKAIESSIGSINLIQ